MLLYVSRDLCHYLLKSDVEQYHFSKKQQEKCPFKLHLAYSFGYWRSCLGISQFLGSLNGVLYLSFLQDYSLQMLDVIVSARQGII